MSAPALPTWQDCHELWSKKRRRQLREQQEGIQSVPSGKPTATAGGASLSGARGGGALGTKPDDSSEGGG